MIYLTTNSHKVLAALIKHGKLITTTEFRKLYGEEFGFSAHTSVLLHSHKSAGYTDKNNKGQWSVTPKGKERYKLDCAVAPNSDQRPQSRRGKQAAPATSPPQAPPTLNTSTRAESVMDQITGLIAENAMLRDALVSLRASINQSVSKLLGEETTHEQSSEKQ